MTKNIGGPGFQLSSFPDRQIHHTHAAHMDLCSNMPICPVCSSRQPALGQIHFGFHYQQSQFGWRVTTCPWSLLSHPSVPELYTLTRNAAGNRSAALPSRPPKIVHCTTSSVVRRASLTIDPSRPSSARPGSGPAVGLISLHADSHTLAQAGMSSGHAE